MTLAQPQSLINHAQWKLYTPRFTLRLAQSDQDLRAAQALRFQVFNLELGEGLASSFSTGRDEDRFDKHCDHLLLTSNVTGKLVGTYRLQTAERAAAGQGFYAATEFDLTFLPAKITANAVELGRACITPEHRNTEALLLLWRGIAAYLRLNSKRYLFGCCSLNSASAREAWALRQQLNRTGHLHQSINIPPLPDFACPDETAQTLPAAVSVPKLLQSYLRFGAKLCSTPAFDREFGTIDFFTLFDLNQLSERARQLVGG